MPKFDFKFNVNHYVKVKLTEYGKDVFKRKSYFKLKKEDEDGYTEFQLWDFMSIFGSEMRITLQNMPFDTNIIFVGAECLECEELKKSLKTAKADYKRHKEMNRWKDFNDLHSRYLKKCVILDEERKENERLREGIDSALLDLANTRDPEDKLTSDVHNALVRLLRGNTI